LLESNERGINKKRHRTFDKNWSNEGMTIEKVKLSKNWTTIKIKIASLCLRQVCGWIKGVSMLGGDVSVP